MSERGGPGGASRYVIAGGVLLLVVVVGAVLLIVGGAQDANDNGAGLGRTGDPVRAPMAVGAGLIG